MEKRGRARSPDERYSNQYLGKRGGEHIRVGGTSLKNSIANHTLYLGGNSKTSRRLKDIKTTRLAHDVK